MSTALIHSSDIIKRPGLKFNKKRSFGNLKFEDAEIVKTLKSLEKDLHDLQDGFNLVTDPILTDSYIFEIQSVNMKYKYYLRLCKERGIIAQP